MSDDSNMTYTEISTNWAYRQVITFDGHPFVLFEKERLLQAEDKYDDPQVEGGQVVATGDMKLEPLEDTLSDRNRRELVATFNSTPTE